MIAARVNCLQSTAAAEEGKRNYLPSMWPLSLRPPPPQQNKGIAENAERTNNVPTRERRARERLVFIGDCNNICRRLQRSSPLTPGESVNVRACGMEDGIIRTLPCSLALFAQRTNVMWRRSRPLASSLRPIWKKRTVLPPKTKGLAC